MNALTIAEGQKYTVTATGLAMSRDMGFDEWLALGDTLKQMDRAVQWWIGDWLNQGEQRYGDMYAQAVDETDAAYGTLRNYKYVASAIELSRRRDNLSFGVHQVIAALPPIERDLVLKLAAAENWTVREARQAIADRTGRPQKERVITQAEALAALAAAWEACDDIARGTFLRSIGATLCSS
jgi:hypothetical protein